MGDHTVLSSSDPASIKECEDEVAGSKRKVMNNKKAKANTCSNSVDASQPAKKPKNSFSSFTIEAILGLTKGPKEAKQCHNKKTRKTSVNNLHLKFMEILKDIREQRTKVGDSLEHMTECRICGNCSFTQSKSVAASYMTQHLFTHTPYPIYSCLLCKEYGSSWKQRVENHIRVSHACSKKEIYEKFIHDHRYDLDQFLTALALQCYKSCINIYE